MVTVSARGNGTEARFAALLFLLFALLARPAVAGEFKISPILQTVAAGQSMASYRLRNTGEQSITVQVSAFDWRQENGERLLEETARLLVVPPLTTIAAGEEQLVRIALKEPKRREELAFRVLFEEIPSRAPSRSLTVSTALRIDIPLFFTVEKARPDLRWELSRDADGALRLRAHNRGNAHARFSALVLEGPGGRELAAESGPIYLLAGNARSWRFAGVPADIAGEITLRTESGNRHESHVLVVE